MRVVHLACVAPPEIGGIGTVAAREVAGLRLRGVDASLFAPAYQPAPATALQDGLADRSFIHRVQPRWRFGNAAWLPKLVLDELRRSSDVIHLHYPFYGTAIPLLWRRHRRPPVVISYHMDAMATGLKQGIFWFHRTFVQPRLLDHGAKVLVSSYDYARRSSLRDWFDLHPERVKESPFGVDTEMFSPGLSARPRFSLPTNVPVLLFVGGMDRAHAFKGVTLLLRTFKQLVADIPTQRRPHLLMVGDGDVRGQYQRQAIQDGLGACVHFVGRLDQISLRDAYRSADVFVFPSLNRAEAFGLAALEALSSGVPVIASDLPGVRTVVRHGETGILFPPQNQPALLAAMRQMLADEPRRAEMKKTARAWALSRFSWEQHIDDLMAVYEEVVIAAQTS